MDKQKDLDTLGYGMYSREKLGEEVSPKSKKNDDWEERLQRRYDKGKFSYKPWIFGW